MADVSNQQLALEFFKLLTEGFHAEPLEDDPEDPQFESKMLQRTKGWRRELWRAFYQVEERLCPRPPAQPRPDYVKIISGQKPRQT